MIFSTKPVVQISLDLTNIDEALETVALAMRARVGGLSLEQAIKCSGYGAPPVVLRAPLTIDANAFKTADGGLEESLRRICAAVARLHGAEVAVVGLEADRADPSGKRLSLHWLTMTWT